MEAKAEDVEGDCWSWDAREDAEADEPARTAGPSETIIRMMKKARRLSK
jgi:hypothetical protein